MALVTKKVYGKVVDPINKTKELVGEYEVYDSDAKGIERVNELVAHYGADAIASYAMRAITIDGQHKAKAAAGKGKRYDFFAVLGRMYNSNLMPAVANANKDLQQLFARAYFDHNYTLSREVEASVLEAYNKSLITHAD